MIFKKLITSVVFVILFWLCAYAKETSFSESEQQISDFSLSGYGEKGKKTWDLSGKSADIFTDTVKLKSVVSNLYGEQGNIKLTADSGDFNKVDNRVHLEDNVIITTSDGARLTTDSLDWDRRAGFVSTADIVNIHRDNIVAVASGAKGVPNLKQVVLEKDIRVDISPDEKNKDNSQELKEKIVITCDGPLEVNYEKNIAILNNNVKVERADSTIYSDRMEVYFISGNAKAAEKSPGMMNNRIEKIIARGNVKVVQGENISYSEEAIYTALDKKIILNGRPKLIIYSTEDLNNASSGN